MKIFIIALCLLMATPALAQFVPGENFASRGQEAA